MLQLPFPSLQNCLRNEWNIENVDEDGAGPSNYQQESNSCDFNEIVEDELSNTSASFIATFGKNEYDCYAHTFYNIMPKDRMLVCSTLLNSFIAWSKEKPSQESKLSNERFDSNCFGRFMITQTSLGNRENVLLARNLNYGSHVILKFYASKSLFENSRALHRELSNSSHVCKYIRSSMRHNAFSCLIRLLDDIEEKDFPPCLVFQKGDITLDEWLVKASPNPLDRKAVLYQVHF